MPMRWACSATRWGLRSTSSSISRVCWRAVRVCACSSSAVVANAACCMEVLKSSSPTTPPSISIDMRTTNGTFEARVRRRGTTRSRARSTAASRSGAIRERSWTTGLLIGRPPGVAGRGSRAGEGRDSVGRS